MNKEKLQQIRQAGVALCSYCESDMCEWCQVTRLISEAETEFENQQLLEEDDEDYYICSSTNGDYSPSCPWNAPGMSVKDFI